MSKMNLPLRQDLYAQCNERKLLEADSILLTEIQNY